MGMPYQEARDSLSHYLKYGGEIRHFYDRKDDNKFYDSKDDLNTCPYSKIIEVPWLTISVVNFKNCKLTFYNDSLVQIQTDGAIEIQKALTAKYGESTLKTDTKKVTCRYKYTGAENEEEENIYTNTWRSDSISCYTTLDSYLNDDCQRRTLYYFFLGKPDYTIIIARCNAQMRKNANQQEIDSLKSKLDGF